MSIGSQLPELSAHVGCFLFFRDLYWFVWKDFSLRSNLRSWTFFCCLLLNHWRLLFSVELWNLYSLVNIIWSFLTRTCKKSPEDEVKLLNILKCKWQQSDVLIVQIKKGLIKSNCGKIRMILVQIPDEIVFVWSLNFFINVLIDHILHIAPAQRCIRDWSSLFCTFISFHVSLL